MQHVFVLIEHPNHHERDHPVLPETWFHIDKLS